MNQNELKPLDGFGVWIETSTLSGQRLFVLFGSFVVFCLDVCLPGRSLIGTGQIFRLAAL